MDACIDSLRMDGWMDARMSVCIEASSVTYASPNLSLSTGSQGNSL